jgi:hypothetical protein
VRRPIFRPGLDPTLGEFFDFLLWLVVVLLSMTAMYLIPAFNLVFWPILWTYDHWKETRPRGETSLDPMVRLEQVELSKSLWDRELDG